MPLTYSYDLTTDVGKIRLLIQDNDLTAVDPSLAPEERSAAFADEELQALADMEGDVYQAAAVALRAWSTNKQLIVIARKFGRGELDYGQIRDDMQKAAEAYHQQSITTPADGFAEQAWDEQIGQRIIINAWSREVM